MKKGTIEKDPYRTSIYEKIAEYERAGRFDEDVEDDPPTKPLLPDAIDYLNTSLSYRIRRKIAFFSAYAYFAHLERTHEIVLHPAEGLENLKNTHGAVITCNHFHPMDSFIMQRVFDASKHKNRLYRVIREGNYTSFPGFYGFLMRNCNTLPLSSSLNTMKKFIKATDTVLAQGNCVLIYPEQSMWWNYRKPKPLKNGAFDIALRNQVPVVPCFITMEDTYYIGADGYPVQAYTPHIGEPIYPDATLPRPLARQKLCEETERFCRETYERIYGISLSYCE